MSCKPEVLKSIPLFSLLDDDEQLSWPGRWK
jgi:hypothetical protein